WSPERKSQMSEHPSNARLADVLRQSTDDELRPLYDLLHDRVAGRCTTPQDLGRELRLDGSNTVVTWLFRLGRPVDYFEVVRNVAAALKAVAPRGDDEREWELAILGKVVDEYLRDAPEAEREEIE